MSNFVKFNSIDQLRHFVKDMEYHGKKVVNLTGTVKIHGTNSAIGYDIQTKELFVQSRNNIITVEKDNAGFAMYVEQNKQFFKEHFEHLAKDLNVDTGFKSIILYGEWAGGDIQKGVAINEVEKFFAPFELKYVKHDDSYNLGNVSDFYNSEIRCFPVTVFQKYHVKLDLNNVEEAQQQIVDLTLKVEECCPVGEFFGIKGIGEGIVFTDESGYHKFKSKGEKHSVSKVKTIAPVDVEKVAKVKDFVDYAVTENRLNQGLDYFKEMHLEVDAKNTAQFIKWVTSDVYKEELDTVIANDLDWKAVAKSVANKARQWFMTKC